MTFPGEHKQIQHCIREINKDYDRYGRTLGLAVYDCTILLQDKTFLKITGNKNGSRVSSEKLLFSHYGAYDLLNEISTKDGIPLLDHWDSYMSNIKINFVLQK